MLLKRSIEKVVSKLSVSKYNSKVEYKLVEFILGVPVKAFNLQFIQCKAHAILKEKSSCKNFLCRLAH